MALDYHRILNHFFGSNDNYRIFVLKLFSDLDEIKIGQLCWITVEIMTNGVSHSIPFASAINIGPFSN